MFIQTEPTPNPNAIKFIPGFDVVAQGSYDFRNAESADKAPLVQRLFKLNGVEGVYLAREFISVTKNDDVPWDTLKPRVLAAIMDHATSGLPVLDAALESAASQAADPHGESDVIMQIRDILDTRIRPAVAMDGGDIVFDRFEDGIVFLEMRGACSGCPSSSATLKNGVESMLRHFIPEVLEVRSVL